MIKHDSGLMIAQTSMTILRLNPTLDVTQRPSLWFLSTCIFLPFTYFLKCRSSDQPSSAISLPQWKETATTTDDSSQEHRESTIPFHSFCCFLLDNSPCMIMLVGTLSSRSKCAADRTVYSIPTLLSESQDRTQFTTPSWQSPFGVRRSAALRISTCVDQWPPSCRELSRSSDMQKHTQETQGSTLHMSCMRCIWCWSISQWSWFA